MLSNKDWKKLTDSRFFRAEIGVTYTLVLKNTRMELVKFGEHTDEKPAFVADVVQENGMDCNKRFETKNRDLCMQLQKYEERERTEPYTIHLYRTDRNTYTIIDPRVVSQVVNNAQRN